METHLLIRDLDIEGITIDNGWIKNLKHANGKINTNAILILAELVRSYTPIETRDTKTGKLISCNKKFEGDKLMITYRNMAERLGISKLQAKRACDYLRNKGIITLEFRNVVVDSVKYINVMYVDLNVENLQKITGADAG